MPPRPLRSFVAVVAVSALVVAGCGSGARRSTDAAATPGGAPASTAAVTGSLDVFAAASLTGAFTAARAALSASHRELALTYNLGGSNTLVTQILQGAPADVFASADQKNMQRLVAAGLVDPPVTFARNKLAIAVAPGNPKKITGLSDLARPGVSVVLEAAGVPAGDYARAVLAAQHLTVVPRSLETDVKSALAKVTTGEADAAVVYVTDVRAAGAQVSGVPIADALQPDITYPIAVVRSTRNRTAAQAFVDSAVSGAVQRSLEAAGFLAPR